MDRFLCADHALQHFANKEHTIECEEFAGNKFEFRTYEVEVAVFGDDFHASPKVESLRIRLSDEEYLLLLQWQLQHPKAGFNACICELSNIAVSIECQIEDRIFGEGEVGTYAVSLAEVRKDAELILRNLEVNK